jgi:hypothetical protein
MTLPNVPKDENMPEAVRGWLERLKREIETALSSVDALVIPAKATEAEATTGTNDDKYLSPLAGVASVLAHSPFVNYAHFQHQENNGTDGGGGSTGSDLTRTINTTLYNSIGAVLGSNQIALEAGTYFIWAAATFHRVRQTRIWLYNVTDAAITLNGMSANAPEVSTDDNSAVTTSVITGRFTIAATKTFDIRCRVNRSNSPTGFGRACDFGGNETYLDCIIWKLD